MSPFCGAGFADGVLLPEKTGLMNRLVRGNDVGPVDSDEILAHLLILSVFAEVVFFEHVEAWLWALGGFKFKIDG